MDGGATCLGVFEGFQDHDPGAFSQHESPPFEVEGGTAIRGDDPQGFPGSEDSEHDGGFCAASDDNVGLTRPDHLQRGGEGVVG